jgi:murein DD-endopeptidase MepM/ murein hydrolase activator NlpD
VEFEAVMLKQMLSAMRQGNGSTDPQAAASPLSGYQDMLDSQLAQAMARAGGVGIARVLERQWGLPGVPAAAAAAGASLPGVVEAAHVSSGFGPRRDPLTGVPAFHAGVDLAAAEGSPVRPLAPGVVVFAGESPGYGLSAVVDHGAGRQSRYAHLSALRVRAGQAVGAGDPLGEVGNTGRSTGPHLHLELRVRGEPVDPLRSAHARALLSETRTQPGASAPASGLRVLSGR